MSHYIARLTGLRKIEQFSSCEIWIKIPPILPHKFYQKGYFIVLGTGYAQVQTLVENRDEALETVVKEELVLYWMPLF